jgi:hypothetical protein
MSDQQNVIPDEDCSYVTIFEFRKLLVDTLASGTASEELKQWVGRVLSDAWEDGHDGLTDDITKEITAAEEVFLAAKLQRQKEKL